MALPLDFDIALIALSKGGGTSSEDNVLNTLIRELAEAAMAPEIDCQPSPQPARERPNDTITAPAARQRAIDLQQWQQRALQSHYPFVWFATTDYRVKTNGTCTTKSVCIVLGLNLSGKKEVLGLYIVSGSEAGFWLSLLRDLNTRGVQDILISVVATDGSNGFLDAISQTFPQTDVQLCVNHQIRYSLRQVADKNQQAVMAALSSIHDAENRESADAALAELEGRWGHQYPTVTQSWRNNWQHLSANFDYPAAIRRVIHTTDPIEVVCRPVRAITTGKVTFADENSLMSLLYTAIQKGR
ncbi:IS256 family transposase [Exilibacterium tricleocarpae]|uniref:Mutator family transposase n=1 Tax=Exilibacterium tricleocarpae TaxID=2591008 RepID=A0A545U9B7_9GAMM|nr:transposase [Exilibacterium tricleocarpae]TQV86061.1 IS256 family transposase [Exilibacterium tricleocarpae]